MKKLFLTLLCVVCAGVCVLAFMLLNPREDILKLANMQDGTIGQSGKGRFLIADTTEPVQQDVYILFDYKDDEVFHDSYLAIKMESGVLLYNLSKSGIGSYDDLLYICDVDGDGADEIIVQRTVGMTGGAGQYVSQIFKIENDQIIEMFSSSPKNKFDTGFSAKMRDDYVLVVVNRFTGYERNVDISDKGNYLGVFYNDRGKVIREQDFLMDSFYEFSPTDVDNDGVFEIKAYQYTSLYGHADYVGTAVSILKYSSNTKKFCVIETEFRG